MIAQGLKKKKAKQIKKSQQQLNSESREEDRLVTV